MTQEQRRARFEAKMAKLRAKMSMEVPTYLLTVPEDQIICDPPDEPEFDGLYWGRVEIVLGPPRRMKTAKGRPVRKLLRKAIWFALPNREDVELLAHRLNLTVKSIQALLTSRSTRRQGSMSIQALRARLKMIEDAAANKTLVEVPQRSISGGRRFVFSVQQAMRKDNES